MKSISDFLKLINFNSDWIKSEGFREYLYHAEKQFHILKIIVPLEKCCLLKYAFICNQFSIEDNALSKKQKIFSPTRNTPEVILDTKGIIRMTGRLIPENPEDFFRPIEEWINEYFCNPAEITKIEICLEYMNSSGSKYLFYIIHKIINIRLENNIKRFIVNWYYRDEDVDMLEKGTVFSTNLNVPFNFIKII
jgi:SiaC family regulatory phosphoprotein